MTRAPRRALRVAAVLVAAASPLMLSSYYVSLFSYIGIYTLVALGLVLLTGASGLASLGQAAFVGVGAYTTAVISARFGLSPWLGLAAALANCALLAFVLGLISLRLSSHYFAVITIAWGMTLFLLFENLHFLGGHSGIGDIPPVSLLGISLSRGAAFFYLTWLCVALCMLAAANLLRSRQGRAIRTLRGGDALLLSLGIDPFRLRLAVFVIAGLLAGLAGWLYAHMQGYISPAPFSVSDGITFLLMAVVGGTGSIWGALIGAAAITALRTVLQDLLPLLTSKAGNLEVVVYGVLFIVLLQRARGGVIGLAGRLWPSPAGEVAEGAQMAQSALPKRDMPGSGTVLLRISHLTRRFGGLVAVDDASFDLNAGEVLGLIGPNGAGKSTTFDIVSGLLRPTEGTITFCGIELSGGGVREFVRHGMARTFQHVKLRPGMTVLENVMLGAHTRSRAGILDAIFMLDGGEERSLRQEAMIQLDRVGLARRACDLAGTLPLGQQRILEVARALAADPVLLLLDEPAAGLRQHEKAELAKLLNRLRFEGMAVLLVEHDMDFVMGLVDRIVVLEFGRKLAEGRPEEIRTSARVQEAYLGGVA